MVNLTCNHRTVQGLPGCCILIQPLNSALVARRKSQVGTWPSTISTRTQNNEWLFFQFGDQDMNRHGAKTAYDGYQWLLVAIKSLMVINGYCWWWWWWWWRWRWRWWWRQGTLICIFFPYTAGDDHSNFSRVTHKYHCPCYDLQKPEWNLF